MVKKKKALKTVVSFILDSTGSMIDIEDATISGVNEYISGLKKHKGSMAFSLTTFNSMEIKTPYVKAKLSDVKKLTNKTYRPNHMTPLYDAVCKTVAKLEKTIKKDEAVIVAIMTDGMENSSMEYTQEHMRKMIKRLEKKGNWTFAYLGANQDSYAVAQDFGIKRGNIIDWQANNAGTKHVMAVVAGSTMDFASSNAEGVSNTSKFFSKDEEEVKNGKSR